MVQVYGVVFLILIVRMKWGFAIWWRRSFASFASKLDFAKFADADPMSSRPFTLKKVLVTKLAVKRKSEAEKGVIVACTCARLLSCLTLTFLRLLLPFPFFLVVCLSTKDVRRRDRTIEDHASTRDDHVLAPW